MGSIEFSPFRHKPFQSREEFLLEQKKDKEQELEKFRQEGEERFLYELSLKRKYGSAFDNITFNAPNEIRFR